jgi:hypothetical protein
MDPDARFDAAIEIACQETRKIRTPVRFDHHNEAY